MKRCNGISAWNKRTTEPKASKASVRHQRLQGSAPLAAKLGSQISAPLDESNVQVFPQVAGFELRPVTFFLKHLKPNQTGCQTAYHDFSGSQKGPATDTMVPSMHDEECYRLRLVPAQSLGGLAHMAMQRLAWKQIHVGPQCTLKIE